MQGDMCRKGEGVATWVPTVAGSYTFQHTTAGSAETLTATFNVTAKDMASAVVDVDCSTVTYSGSDYAPAISCAELCHQQGRGDAAERAATR